MNRAFTQVLFPGLILIQQMCSSLLLNEKKALATYAAMKAGVEKTSLMNI